MFTAEKSKLFFNDPKFLKINTWQVDSQQAATAKIFSGQKQLRRSKVNYTTIDKNISTANNNEYLLLDFLQSRMNAYEQQLANRVEQTFLEKERIKDKYSQAQDLYEKANRKLKKLMFLKHQLSKYQAMQMENQVQQIQRIYQENQQLKTQNDKLKKRIEKKQVQMGSIRK